MKIHLIVFALLFAFSTSAVAANPGAPIQWDRGSAMAAATSVNVEQAVYDLGLIASLADGEANVTIVLAQLVALLVLAYHF